MRLTVNFFSVFLVLFFLFLNLQMLAITGWMTNENSTLKVYHLFSLLFIPCLLLRLRSRLPLIPPFIFEYFVGIILISLLLFLFYPFNRMLINHIFAFYAFYIGYYIAGLFTQEHVLALFQRAAIIVFVIIVGKLLFHIPEIIRFMKAPDGHPAVYTIYGGGVNLEATWLGLNTALFINRKKLFYFLLLSTLFISTLYASRVGIVISLLVAGFKFISAATSKEERSAIILLGILAVLSFVAFIDFDNLAEKVYAFRRFAEFGDSSDKGMSGRFAMWRYYGSAIWENKFMGYGAGNGMYAIESVSGRNYPEDNLHNLYMQVLIEFGIIGFVLYLLVVYNLSFKALKSRLSNPFGIIILVYFIASLVQFRGTDAIIWLYIGTFIRLEAFKKSDALHE